MLPKPDLNVNSLRDTDFRAIFPAKLIHFTSKLDENDMQGFYADFDFLLDQLILYQSDPIL